MGLRFFRRVRIAPGVTLNFSKSGASVSAGPRGAKVTVGPRGVRRTVGLPGTGLYYTENNGWGQKQGRRGSRGGRAAEAPPAAPPVAQEDRLSLGFFKRLITPKAEEDLVDGLRLLLQGQTERAMSHLAKASHLADGAFLAGYAAMKLQRHDHAARYLEMALQRSGELGRYFRKYEVDATVSVTVTPHVTAHIGPRVRGVRLLLAEVYQLQGQPDKALEQMRLLRRALPDDPVVTLSLVELLVEEDGSARACQRVVELTRDVDNDSEVHAAILMYKGQALARLGLHTAARDTLTQACRRTKDRSDELLRAVRYQRALVYEELGQRGQARRELEKIYAEDPGHQDVAQRLGLS